jgi:hypothetical protein
MATSTIIQFLGPGEAGDTSNRSQRETFIASTVISSGDWVSFDTSKTGADRVLYVGVIDTSGGAIALGVPVIGVATQNAAIGDNVEVVIGGYAGKANVATGTAAGIAVALDTTTSGRAVAADAANVNIAGITLAVAASNSAPVHVLKQF